MSAIKNRYQKKYGKKRRNYRKKPVSKVGQAMELANKALVMAKAVKGLVNVEWKTLDGSFTTAPAASFSSPVYMTNCSQGTSQSNRVGDSIRIKSVACNVTFHSGTADDTVRFILFLDKSPNGATPNVLEIYRNNNFDTFRNPDFMQRFVILTDKQINLSVTGQNEVSYRYYKEMNHEAKYQSNTATVSDAANGHLFAIWIARSGVVGVQTTGKYRIRYIDN